MARTTRLASRFSIHPAAIALGAALLLPASVLAPTADAQNIRFASVSRAGGDDFSPSISRAHFKRYAKVLGLEGDLSVIAAGLVDGYHDEFRREAAIVRKKMDDLREEAAATQDFSVFSREMPDIMTAWSAKRDALENELLTNLQALLTDEQRAMWPVVERERRRHQLLPTGRLSGENVDLIELVEQLRDAKNRPTTSGETAGMPEEVDQLLEQYSHEMDSALQSRQRHIEPLQQGFFQALMNDRAEGERMWKEATEKRKTVREVNRRFLAALKATLGEVDGEKLHQEFMEQAYPAAYAPTKAEKFFELALDLPSLSSDQANALEAYRQSLNARLEPLRRDIVRYTDEADEELPPMFRNMQVTGGGGGGAVSLTMTSGFGGGGEESSPLQEALRDRFRASRDALEQGENVLTPEQRESLPEIEAESDMMRTLRIGSSML